MFDFQRYWCFFGKWWRFAASGTERWFPFEDTRFKLFAYFFPIGWKPRIIVKFIWLIVVIKGIFLMRNLGGWRVHRFIRHQEIDFLVILIFMHFIHETYSFNLLDSYIECLKYLYFIWQKDSIIFRVIKFCSQIILKKFKSKPNIK